MGALLDLALETGRPDESPQHFSAAVREREERVDQAIRMLREASGRHAAFVAGQSGDGHVPVTVVLSTSQGLLTGELNVPEDRWDPWLFLQFLREQDGGVAS